MAVAIVVYKCATAKAPNICGVGVGYLHGGGLCPISPAMEALTALCHAYLRQSLTSLKSLDTGERMSHENAPIQV